MFFASDSHHTLGQPSFSISNPYRIPKASAISGISAWKCTNLILRTFPLLFLAMTPITLVPSFTVASVLILTTYFGVLHQLRWFWRWTKSAEHLLIMSFLASRNLNFSSITVLLRQNGFLSKIDWFLNFQSWSKIREANKKKFSLSLGSIGKVSEGFAIRFNFS